MKIKELLKNKKVMIASAVVLLIVVVVIIVARRKRKSETVDGTSQDSTSQDSSILGSLDPVLKYPKASFPLTPYSKAGEYSAEAGSYGQQIAILQDICNKHFRKNLDVDGKFGPKSENAFMSCFGSPFAPPYSEEVYNGFVLRYPRSRYIC